MTVDGRQCMSSTALDVDVLDAYAFDVHESVTLSVVVDTENSPPSLAVLYDKVGGPGNVTVALESDQRIATFEVELTDARFANRGDFATDLMLVGVTGAVAPAPAYAPVVVCDITVTRKPPSGDPPGFGWLDLTIQDETGAASAVRMGLYDSDDRLPIVSEDAALIREFSDRTRTYLMQASTIWPSDNRFVFYADGTYRARVPAGSYRLVASKGIEYRFVDRTIEVKPGVVVSETIRLQRYANQPAAGWFSGDVHIHNLRQDSADNRSLLVQTRGEDLHVSNILKMGNVAGTHFPQLGWGESGRYTQGRHSLVAGQEDPRTLTLGHTIHLNIDEPVRFPDEYLSYHKVFEAVAAQGGISGFAHAAGGLPGTAEGMTMQAAFGLLDFGEVMQGGAIGTDVWFALLNLGYRIAPAAGTDYPYIDHPGAVRSYVKSLRGYAIDAWFEGMDKGHTYVTNGPFLSFTLNGHEMGSEVRVSSGDSLQFVASASLNPDLGALERIELIKFGEVIASDAVASGIQELELSHQINAGASGWYVVHAVANRPGHDGYIGAMTAPVYVVVDDDVHTWNRSAAPQIANNLINTLEAVKNRSADTVIESEGWQSMPVWAEQFDAQLAVARARIEEVQARLRNLAQAAVD